MPKLPSRPVTDDDLEALRKSIEIHSTQGGTTMKLNINQSDEKTPNTNSLKFEEINSTVGGPEVQPITQEELGDMLNLQMPADEETEEPPMEWSTPTQEFQSQYANELINVCEFTPMNVLATVYSEVDTGKYSKHWYENYEDTLMENIGALTRMDAIGRYYVSFIDTEGETPALAYAAAQTIAHELVSKYHWASVYVAVVDKAEAVKHDILSESYGTEGLVLYFVLFPFDVHQCKGIAQDTYISSISDIIADDVLGCPVARMICAIDSVYTHEFNPHAEDDSSAE